VLDPETECTNAGAYSNLALIPRAVKTLSLLITSLQNLETSLLKALFDIFVKWLDYVKHMTRVVAHPSVLCAGWFSVACWYNVLSLKLTLSRKNSIHHLHTHIHEKYKQHVRPRSKHRRPGKVGKYALRKTPAIRNIEAAYSGAGTGRNHTPGSASKLGS